MIWNKCRISCICSFCHFLHRFILRFLGTILLPPSLHPLFNKRALVVIAQSGTTSLLIQMSNNAAAAPTHTCKYTYTHTGCRLSLHVQIHIIDLSPTLPSLSHAPFFIFNEWIVDLAARYRYVSIKCRQGSVLTHMCTGCVSEQHGKQRSKVQPDIQKESLVKI